MHIYTYIYIQREREVHWRRKRAFGVQTQDQICPLRSQIPISDHLPLGNAVGHDSKPPNIKFQSFPRIMPNSARDSSGGLPCILLTTKV